jgi:hypothetical protein
MTITSQPWLDESASWQTGTQTASVVRANGFAVGGFGMGDVCAQTSGYALGTSAHKRHADAMKANPVAGRLPWSPPGT